MRHSKNWIFSFVASFAVVVLPACGGGGTDDSGVSSGTAEGLWRGATVNDLSLALVVRDSGDYFAFYSSSDAPNNVGVVTGKGQSLNGVFSTPAVVGSNRIIGNYVAHASFNGSFVPADPLAMGVSFTLGFDSTYDARPTQAAVVGTYATNLGMPLGGSAVTPSSGPLSGSLTIASDGAMSGMPAGTPLPSGCTISGFAVPTTGKGNLYDVRITYASACSGTRFNGVAYYDVLAKRLIGFLESDTGQTLTLVAAK